MAGSPSASPGPGGSSPASPASLGSGSTAGRIDTRVAHPARVQDYWLGGRDNFAADRAAGAAVLAASPGLVASVRAGRAFLGRAVRYLAGPAGIGQFLDIGAGIPAAGNTHEVAQSVAAQARVVYVDNDPVVFGHARALLASVPHGSTDYLQADLRDPEKILAEAASLLDLSQPVAVVLMEVLQFVPDRAQPQEIVACLLDTLPPGSALLLAHPASDIAPRAAATMADQLSQLTPEQVTPRTQAEIMPFFNGLRLVPPGLVRVPQWRPESRRDAAAVSATWGGVGRK